MQYNPECIFCLEEFKENDIVVTLTCHPTHVYHEDCLGKYLRHNVEQNENRPKCPMCQQDIRFRK